MIDARWVGERFATDPAFHLPQRPRFPRELLVVPTDEGLCVEGAFERQLLRGKAARDFLPQLIALLDGTRSLSDLAAEFAPRPPEHVAHAITLLYSRGLLEDGPPGDDGDVRSFLGRFVDNTRHHRNRDDAVALLARASATIAAPPEIASMLRADLLSSGVGRVNLHLGGGAYVPSDLTIVVETESYGAAAFARDAALHGAWVLYATIARDGATVGPLAVPGLSPCYDCYREYYAGEPGPAAGADERWWAGVLGTNVFNLLSRIAFPQLFNRVQRMRRFGNDYQSVRDVAPRVPSCGVCGTGADLGPRDPAFTAWALHTMTAMPPRALLNHRTYQDHFKASNIELARKLPAVREGVASVRLNGGAPPVHGVLDGASLGAILRDAAGYRELPGGELWRLTPTGGNLGSPELYVIARDVGGLADGVYRYVGARHVLERVRPFDLEDARTIAGSGGDGPRAIVVGTGLLDRVFAKYHAFGYRVVTLDAGVCLASVLLASASRGLHAVEHPDFEPKHAASILRLNARTTYQLPTFVLSLAQSAQAGPVRFGTDVLQRVIHADADRVRAAHELSAPLVRGWSDLLARRRSVRDFAPVPLERTALETILAQASAVAAHRRDVRGRSVPLRAFVAVAHDAPGLRAGLYLYRDGLRRTADLPCDGMGALFQQENMRSAAAGVFITANLEHVFAGRGTRGYGEALTAAGVFAAGVIHAATAAGVDGCPSGGFFEQGLREMQDCDGFRDCPVFAVALGHARRKG
ncbi:MAG: nitroreductase family protein, partial [Candidatus Eremiobacteraeota bacterium]|nr:nitroreductase family protein [Candidatus Eremiobacteraeota bacterium]